MDWSWDWSRDSWRDRDLSANGNDLVFMILLYFLYILVVLPLLSPKLFYLVLVC